MVKARFYVYRVTQDGGREFVRTCTNSPTRNVAKEWTQDPKAARRFAYGSARSVAHRNGGFLASVNAYR